MNQLIPSISRILMRISVFPYSSQYLVLPNLKILSIWVKILFHCLIFYFSAYKWNWAPFFQTLFFFNIEKTAICMFISMSSMFISFAHFSTRLFVFLYWLSGILYWYWILLLFYISYFIYLFLKLILLVYCCFTMLCSFLLCSKVNQIYI